MNKMFQLLVIAGALAVLPARADEGVIVIGKDATRVIPVAISGFSDEVSSVLRFDLSVLGFDPNAASDAADYLISGRDNSRVEGSLTPKGASGPVWSRAYAGGSLRTQTHAFADDIVHEIRGTAPIFLSKIAFRQQAGQNPEICVSDYDGYNVRQITRDNTLVGAPSWIPGGRGLIYTSWRTGDGEVLEHSLATGARRVVARYPGDNLEPEVSPDGRRVAMILSKGGSPNLYVGDLDGGGLLQLTRTREDDSSPTWSPDGDRICFVCRRGRARLQIISASGGTAQPLNVAGAWGNLTSPDWSPDGKQIAFTSGSGNFIIWVVPSQGGPAEKLVEGEDPCWAPNSRTIIFSRRNNNKQVLCLLDVPTKHVKYLRQISGSCSEPAWAR